MRIEKVVVNSSPLIVLFRSGQADLLPRLFKEIVVPEQVYAEILAGGEDDSAKRALPRTEWVTRKKVEIRFRHPDAWHRWAVGACEASWSDRFGEGASKAAKGCRIVPVRNHRSATHLPSG